MHIFYVYEYQVRRFCLTLWSIRVIGIHIGFCILANGAILILLCYMHVATKRSIDVALEVNLRHPLCTGEETCKRGIHPSFEIHCRRHQKSKTGVSVTSQKELMSSIFFKKKLRFNFLTSKNMVPVVINLFFL